jgi:hypothetical protein
MDAWRVLQVAWDRLQASKMVATSPCATGEVGDHRDYLIQNMNLGRGMTGGGGGDLFALEACEGLQDGWWTDGPLRGWAAEVGREYIKACCAVVE